MQKTTLSWEANKMSDETMKQLVKEVLFKEEFDRLEQIIYDIHHESKEIEKERKRIEDGYIRLEYEQKLLEKERKKLKNEVLKLKNELADTSDNELKRKIYIIESRNGLKKQKIDDIDEKIDDKMEIRLKIIELEKEYEKIKGEREELTNERIIIERECKTLANEIIGMEHDLEKVSNIRLKRGIEKLSKIKDLTPQNREMIDSLIH